MSPRSTIHEEPTREPQPGLGGAFEIPRPDSDPPTCRGPVADQPAVPVYASIAGGRYRIGRELGRGGMGIVFEAWDTQLERPVAIKLLAAAADHHGRIQRFLREARIASRLGHRGVMAIHEFGLEGDGQAYIVMSLLRGCTLKDLLAARGDLLAEMPHFLAVFLQVCQAIACGHEEGVIHRDLKPGNVMVGDYGMVTVMDWGLAKVLGEPDLPDDGPDADDCPSAAGGGVHTVCGTVFGTPNYLAPEQARGDNARVDKRADVFGLGAILCEILTGRAPFAAGDTAVLWSRAAAGDVAEALARIEACGAGQPVIDLTRSCLAPDPDDRPPDARAVATELTRYLESGQRRAERELVQFFDLSVDLFCIASVSGYFRRINDNFPRLLGYPSRELLTRRFLDFVHPDDLEKTLAEIDRLARGELTIQFVNRYRRADGRHLWLEWTARSVPEEGLIYAVARDVTERLGHTPVTAPEA
jgi:eukaryotic-like serine/threonine-protein kinase